MSDLAALMKYAPTVAGGFVGRNQANQEKTDELRQLELAELIRTRAGEEARKAQTHPLDLQRMALANKTTEAQLPGVTADSTLKQSNARTATATEAGKIGSTNMKNRMEMVQGAMSQISPYIGVLEGKAPAERHVELDGMFKTMGLPDDLREAMNMKFAKIPAEQLPVALKKIQEAMLRNTPEYAKTMDQESLQQKGALERAKVMASRPTGGSKTPELDDLEAWLMTELKGKPPATRLAILNQYIQRAIASGNTDLAGRLQLEAAEVAKTLASLPQSQPRPGTPDMGALTEGRVPTNPVATPYVPQVGGQAPAPQAPAGGGDLKAKVEASGEPFRPDIFEYRIGPNGKVQKRKKVQ
jgi:hypothetical protein